MAKDLKSITVGELRDLLDGEDPEMPVIFSTDYGDYHHTPQALPIRGEVVGQVLVTETAYSNSGFAVVDEDEDGDEPEPGEEPQRFLLIR